MVRRIVIPFIAFLFSFENAFSQSKIDIDTFRINGIPFEVKGEIDWFSSMLNDSIQNDTTWNYQMRYSPKSNPTNIYAVVGIQIVNNTYYTPSPKEERNFRKQCTVIDTSIGDWQAFYLDYKPQKVKNCKGCSPAYTKAYNIPISRSKTLNILLFAQASNSEIIPIEETFRQFSDRFVKQNYEQLTSMGLINFFAPMVYDTFHVGNFYLRSIIPQGFNMAKCRQQDGVKSTNQGYSIATTDDELHVRVTAKYYSPSDSFIIALAQNDTTVRTGWTSIKTNKSSYGGQSFSYGYSSNQSLTTKRLILMPDGSAILLEFIGDYGLENKQATSLALTMYADLVKTENLSPSRILIVPKHLPPVKNEFNRPGDTKTNKNKSRTLPRPK